LTYILYGFLKLGKKYSSTMQQISALNLGTDIRTVYFPPEVMNYIQSTSILKIKP